MLTLWGLTGKATPSPTGKSIPACIASSFTCTWACSKTKSKKCKKKQHKKWHVDGNAATSDRRLLQKCWLWWHVMCVSCVSITIQIICRTFCCCCCCCFCCCCCYCSLLQVVQTFYCFSFLVVGTTYHTRIVFHLLYLLVERWLLEHFAKHRGAFGWLQQKQKKSKDTTNWKN